MMGYPFVDEGGAAMDRRVMSCISPIAWHWRSAAGFVDKILKGAKPAHVLIEHATKFELAIKLKSARYLGIAAPQSLLQHADEVIQ
jgi:putative tryptophan/tyrosine transport system substrate-binding protein